MSQEYEININGHKFQVSSQYDLEHVKNVESFLNDRIVEASKRSEVYSPTKLATLVALNLSDELLSSQTQHQDHSETLESGLKKLCQKLDDALSKYRAVRENNVLIQAETVEASAEYASTEG